MSPVKGIYVLAISVNKSVTIKVGALGNVTFEKGLYAYVGSAQNNLDKRLRRHFQWAKRKFWHIDYLLANAHASVLKAFYKEAEKPEECTVARGFSEKGFAVKKFGCSDCRCVSHLFRFNTYSLLEDLCLKCGLTLYHLASESLHSETSEA
ncbi:MAG: GIY-YIG nuclease family protein [Candidatus Bathyarchaeales archaeon]